MWCVDVWVGACVVCGWHVATVVCELGVGDFNNNGE